MRHTLTDRNAENKILTCRNPAVTRKFNLLRYNGTVYTIDSGDLNNGLKTIYEADGSEFVFHFHYVENPAVLIEHYGSEEAKFDAASIDSTLKIKEIYESNR